jgi:hypothetical protein
MSWDSLLPEFEEIVILSARICPQASFQDGSMFNFDVGLIVPLSMLAIRCRDPGLRKQAIDVLLSKHGYRERIWDAEAMGHVSKWILELKKKQS